MQGTITLFNTATGEVVLTKQNQIQDSHKEIVYNLLAGKSTYAISYMYVEYQNVDNPSDTIPVPSYLPGDGIEYYQGLADSKDYLRVPILLSPTVEATGITFTAVVNAGTGMHGLPFNSSNNSKTYGHALVAAPGTLEQDIIFSRTYWDTEEQKIIDSVVQLGIQWKLSI